MKQLEKKINKIRDFKQSYILDVITAFTLDLSQKTKKRFDNSL